MDLGLNGKNAIITGGSDGIGLAAAISLSKEGANVAILARTQEKLDNAVTEIKRDAKGKVLAISTDVREESSVISSINKVKDEFGKIDILVNNAALYGSLGTGRFDTLDDKDWDDCMDVNVNGIWRCSKAVINSMRENKSGSIINISSLAALAGLPYALHYSTSKAAVIGMTRAMARELGKDWIRVNAVGPSAVLTEGTKEFFGENLERATEVIASGQSLQRNLVPEDLTGTILYLASDDSKFVTGQTIMVDGGTVFL